MSGYAIIDGSGFEATDTAPGAATPTPWGAPSAEPRPRRFGEREFLWLPRHGDGHTIPPHAINYRANLYALRQAGATAVIGINTVGIISDCVLPGQVLLPDQLIDYTWGREQTYFDGSDGRVRHIEFDPPFSTRLRAALLDAAHRVGVACADGGVYAVAQGPRLETAAEIDRFERDGADVVGMTAMPEAVLAAELELDYASLCLAVNPAAGRGGGSIHADVARYQTAAREQALTVLTALPGATP